MQELQSDLQSTDLRKGGSPFRFSRLTDAGAFSRYGDIEINNRGVTAFSAASGDEFSATGIYTTRNGKDRQTVIEKSGLASLFADVTNKPNISTPNYRISDDIDINNQGDVAFVANVSFRSEDGNSTFDEEVSRLFLKQGDSISVVGETKRFEPIGRIRTLSIANFDLNDRDQVVYKTTDVENRRAVKNQIIFEGKVLASVSSVAGDGEGVGIPVITNDGTIYYSRFAASQINTPGSNDNIFRVAPGSDVSTPVSSTPITPLRYDVSDRGTIAFSGSTPDQGQGTFQLDASGLIKVNDTPTSLDVDVNNRGSIAEWNFGSPRTISLIRNGVKQTVINTNSRLMNSQISDLQFGGLNDRNQIAFAAKFADGTTGLFRADLRRSFSPKVDLSNDELAPADDSAEVSLTA